MPAIIAKAAGKTGGSIFLRGTRAKAWLFSMPLFQAPGDHPSVAFDWI